MAVWSAETCRHAQNKVLLKIRIVVCWRKYLYMIRNIYINGTLIFVWLCVISIDGTEESQLDATITVYQ